MVAHGGLGLKMCSACVCENFRDIFVCPQCHKRVTQHKYSRMSAWTHRWVTRSVTPHQREECRRWLMGQASESRRNRTSSRTINRPDRTPYRPYTRYCLDWVEDAAAPASMAVTSAGNGRSSPQVSASGISGN